jgi:predicted AAA+ superfamily ATPase
MENVERLINRAELVLARLEALLPAPQPELEWSSYVAFKWRKKNNLGFLQVVRMVSGLALDDLHNINKQKSLIDRNTRQFVHHKAANNVLLTGARGTGKSSLIKACLNAYAGEGLRLIEVDKDDLGDLGEIIDMLSQRPERFIIFCDDLSFEEGESGYKALKTALDGSIAAHAENVLIYATSNRRHLITEMMSENNSYRTGEDGEIHPGDTVEEKISLSERFGLRVSFYPFQQDDYLTVVAHWLRHFGFDEESIEGFRGEALVWALERGSRSGRVAWQFARDKSGSKD